MNNDKFLASVMDDKYCRRLTVCGSAKFRELKEKYQAYYTIKKNLVFAPVNYLLIKDEVEISDEVTDRNAELLAMMHDKKMDLSEGIIVVCPNGYIGSHTNREINYAKENNKRVLYTDISDLPEDERDMFYFNNDETYPLYMFKEE